jgi:hypothetical protein
MLYAEEFWRCWRAHSTTSRLPRPTVPATETLRIQAEGGPVEPGQGRTTALRFLAAARSGAGCALPRAG